MGTASDLTLLELQTELNNLHKAIAIVNHLAAELDIHKAMANVRHVALELLDCEKVTLFLMFDRAKELRGEVGPDLVIKVKYGEGVAGTVAVTGETLNIPDAYGHPLFNQEWDKKTGFTTRSLLCCPISDMSGKNVAVLQALNKRNGQAFSESDERTLALFSTHLGNALVKAALHEMAQREKERVAALYTCFRQLQTAEDISDLVAVVSSSLQSTLLQAEAVLTFLHDAARGELWTEVSCGVRDSPMSIRTKVGEGLVGGCAQSKQPSCLMEPDCVNDAVLNKLQSQVMKGARIKSLLVHPILASSGGKCLGVILALNKMASTGPASILYEDDFTLQDCDSVALFSLEVGDALSSRSLELSLASALSVVSSSGAHPDSSMPEASSPAVAADSLLRSQLMQMYFSSAPEYKHMECASPTGYGSPTPMSPFATRSRRRGQSAQLQRSFLSFRHTVSSAQPASLASASTPPLPVSPRRASGSNDTLISHTSLPPGFGLMSSAGYQPSYSVSSGIGIESLPSLDSNSTPPVAATPMTSAEQVILGSSEHTKHTGIELGHRAGNAMPHLFGSPDIICQWDFDFTHYDKEQLIQLAHDMFILSGTIQHFNINIKTLRTFLTAVASHYHDIPYHNANHVCQVLHGVFMLLQTTCAGDMLRPLDRLALLVAALCHDLGHDGHTNTFHVNSQSELARIYNDNSVMENHHCAMTFAVLSKKDCNIFEGLEADQVKWLRKAIISAILCTDMSNHYTLTQEFQKHGSSYDPDEDQDRLLLMKVLLHASDIGTAVRPFHVNDIMSRRVHAEFQAQAEEEQRLGLPITFCVDTADAVMCAKIELNFLDYIVTPLWERLVEVLPQLQPQWATFKYNRAAYAQLVETGQLPDGLQSARGTLSS